MISLGMLDRLRADEIAGTAGAPLMLPSRAEQRVPS